MSLIDSIMAINQILNMSKEVEIIQKLNQAQSVAFKKVAIMQREYDAEEKMFNDIMKNKNISNYMKDIAFRERATMIMKYKNR